MSDSENYGLSRTEGKGSIEAPTLSYLPLHPQSSHAIGLIGCGEITASHLAAYKRAGFNVVAVCDTERPRALKRRDEYYPTAQVYTDYRELLGRSDVEVVDVATHPNVRAPILEAAIQAGKHVLSQKPFALDLDVAEGLVELAESTDRLLAVNQNGRWAPYFSYMREAVRAGVIGPLNTADFVMHFDHNWTAGTPFDQVHHLLLYDFAVHYFDLIRVLFETRRPTSVFSSLRRSRSQRSIPPLLATSVVEFEDGIATVVLGGDTRFGQEDHTILVGEKGTLRGIGPGLDRKEVVLHTAGGHGVAALDGTWFEQGFEGTMAELLCAIEQGREPAHSARDNLSTLELTFAAVASANEGRPVVPGSVRKLMV